MIVFIVVIIAFFVGAAAAGFYVSSINGNGATLTVLLWIAAIIVVAASVDFRNEQVRDELLAANKIEYRVNKSTGDIYLFAKDSTLKELIEVIK